MTAMPAVPARTQLDSHGLGFWLYLMSDAILFALLFATWGVMRHATAGAPAPASAFDLLSVAIETGFLLTSTYTCGLATAAADRCDTGAALRWLGITGLLGLGFVIMEVREFHGMIATGLGPDQSGALSAFFTLIGTHGLHVSVGLLWLLVMGVQLIRFGPDHRVRSLLSRFSAFWHFLDLIWIGIFTLVYLPGVQS